MAMLEALLKHPPSNAWPECLQHCLVSNARTYIPTYKEQLTLSNYLRLSNARRGVARFQPHGEAACAARGRIGGPA